MKKKYISLLLSVCVLSMSACGNTKSVDTVSPVESTVVAETQTETESTTIEETTEIETETETEDATVEETTETETEETTVEETETMSEITVAEETFNPYTMYTNTACNIRSMPAKTGELLGSYPINTEVTVVNEIDGWSQLEYDGCVAFIKSTLLSDSMTEVKKPTQVAQSAPAPAPTTPAESPAYGQYGEEPTPEQLAEARAKAAAMRAQRGTVSPENIVDSGDLSLTPEERAALAEYCREHNVQAQ